MRYEWQSKSDYSDIYKKLIDLLPNSSFPNLKLFFDKGTIRIEDSGLIQIPGTKYDDRIKALRSYGLNYSEIIEYLKKSDLDFIDNVPDFISSPVFQMRNLELRDYQLQAIQNWEKNIHEGVCHFAYWCWEDYYRGLKQSKK